MKKVSNGFRKLDASEIAFVAGGGDDPIVVEGKRENGGVTPEPIIVNGVTGGGGFFIPSFFFRSSPGVTGFGPQVFDSPGFSDGGAAPNPDDDGSEDGVDVTVDVSEDGDEVTVSVSEDGFRFDTVIDPNDLNINEITGSIERGGLTDSFTLDFEENQFRLDSDFRINNVGGTFNFELSPNSFGVGVTFPF